MLTPPEFKEVTNRAAAELAEHGRTAPYEKEWIRRDGSRMWGLFAPTRVAGSGLDTECIEFVVDITDAKHAEAALRDADRAKDEFLAMLAHELRNPMAPMRNALRVLEHELLSERGQQAVAIGQRQFGHLTRLVDDLLEISRVTRGLIELRPESVMVQHVVYGVIDGLAATLEERSQHITFEMPAHPVRLYADPVRLAQIVENLLTNASKYTDPGGHIAVQVTAEAETVTIAVRDTGIGIAPDFLPYIFDLFTQVKTTIDRSRGGLGIGLALVKRLVELHGGTVGCESEGLGKGSTFTVRLPREGRAPA